MNKFSITDFFLTIVVIGTFILIFGIFISSFIGAINQANSRYKITTSEKVYENIKYYDVDGSTLIMYFNDNTSTLVNIDNQEINIERKSK